MLHKNKIIDYLNALNEELKQKNIKGEICLYGGAVMCLVYDARPSTKDIDAIFRPSSLIREAAQKVAKKYDLSHDWLNDGVKGFVVEHKQVVVFDLSHLSVFTPEPEYLLAMKLLASRVDGMDNSDIRFLIKKLQIKTAEEAFSVIQKYYPKNIIKPASQFFIEEIFNKE